YWLCERTNLISPIPGREDHKPAAVKWSLPELNIKLNIAKYENIKIKAADNEKEEEATTDHADHEEQEENEEDDDFVITFKDWLKSQTQKGKKQTVITQKQNFNFHENVDQSATQTNTPQQEQNEDNTESLGCKADDEIEEPPAQAPGCEADDEIEEQAVDLSRDSMTEGDTVNVQQQHPDLDSQEEEFNTIFEDIVGSIPEYYKHEIVPTHEKIQQLKEAVDYWIEKADTRRDMMQSAIESCIKKNSFIQQIWTEKEELEKEIEILKKQLEKEKKEGAKLQGELHALKTNKRQLQEQHELLEGEKLSCIESMKEKDTVIASLKHVMGKNFTQGEQGEITMKEQADKEKKDERIAEESELEVQETPNDEDENADEKTPEKSVLMQAKEVGTRQLRSGIKIIKDRKDRKPAKKPDYTYPEAHKKARKRESQSEDEAPNKKKDKDTYLQLRMYEVYNRLDEKSKKNLENYWISPSDSDEGAFYLHNRTVLYKHNIEKLMGDDPISALIIDAYGEALNDDAKQKPQKQKNAYLSANNYVETANIFLCLLKECAAASLKTKLVQIPDFDAKKPRGLNEASARMIAKMLASNKLTPEYAQTLKYLIRHDTTNFKLTENRECPQQANNS
ncbi:PREDICTED: AT-rich interactive domain-containing 4B, partial [Prunus dulcis]